MTNLTPDILAKIWLFCTEEGGRRSGIPAVQYGCPLFIGGEGFDCRILLDQIGRPLPLGEWVIVPVKFLNLALVRSRLRPGVKFKIWEGKEIGMGEIVEVFADGDD